MLFVTGVERDNVNKLNVSMYIEAQGKYFEKKSGTGCARE